MKLYWLFFTSLILFLSYSCSVEKRIYRSGHYVHWNHKQKKPPVDGFSQAQKSSKAKMGNLDSQPSFAELHNSASLGSAKVLEKNDSQKFNTEKFTSLEPITSSGTKGVFDSSNGQEGNTGIIEWTADYKKIGERAENHYDTQEDPKKNRKATFWLLLILSLFIIGGAFFPAVYAVWMGITALLACFPIQPVRSKVLDEKTARLLLVLLFLSLAFFYAWIYYSLIAIGAAVLLQLALFSLLFFVSWLIRRKLQHKKH